VSVFLRMNRPWKEEKSSTYQNLHFTKEERPEFLIQAFF
jgi:hypothetical protein